jgi:multiple sugar transport system ATP-binding protein
MTMGDRIAVLNEGELQQVGTPRELYESPLNRFVAGFIGSPAMNFATYTVESNGGMSRLVGEGSEVRLDAERNSVLGTQKLEAVEVGVRPEHLQIGAQDEAGIKIESTVDVIEFLGNDQLIHTLASGGRDVVALVRVDEGLTVGDKVVLWAPANRLHFFDPATGATLVRNWATRGTEADQAFRVTGRPADE